MMKYEIFNRCMPGEDECGDAFIVENNEDYFLAAVIDGLGHGVKAKNAASEAVNCIRDNNSEELKIIIEKCHKSLRNTRGAAVSIARADYKNKIISFTGVGNVSFKLNLKKCGQHPIPEPGILGYRFKKVNVFEHPLHKEDSFCMFSDGFSPRFNISDYSDTPLESMIKDISEKHAKDNDDATLFIARYNGE